MRGSSRTSTVTCHSSPSHSRPVTASASYPVSSCTVVIAARPSSAADRLPLSLDRAIALPPIPAQDHQLFDQCVLCMLDFGLVVGARLARGLQLEQRSLDPGLVVELELGLLLEALRDPDRAAHGRERQRDQGGEEAHQAAPAASSMSAKL